MMTALLQMPCAQIRRRMLRQKWYSSFILQIHISRPVIVVFQLNKSSILLLARPGNIAVGIISLNRLILASVCFRLRGNLSLNDDTLPPRFLFLLSTTAAVCCCCISSFLVFISSADFFFFFT